MRNVLSAEDDDYSDQSLWSTFLINSVDTPYWPFYLTLFIFSTTYFYCWIYNNEAKDRWNRWYLVHNLHNGGAILLASLSLLSKTPDGSNSQYSWVHVNERVPILWSLGYFVVDIWDSLVRRDWPYLFHGVACGVLGVANYRTPILYQLKMNSKAAYCELSSPLMHWAKLTRHPVIFLAFAVMFTFCRMLWLPYMYRQCLDAGMPWTHPALLVMAAFYGLNCVWYYKILGILIRGLLLGKGREDYDKKKER
jgi:hypothetical protein